MNPRQRRGVLLMIVAALGAIVVFVSVASYLNSQQQRLGDHRTVLRLAEEVNAYQPVGPDMLEPVQVPAMYFDPEVFIEDLSLLEANREWVAATHLPAGVIMQAGMLIPQPDLAAGEREIAIMVNAETGVAGKVNRGSIVDIYATFTSLEDSPPCAVRVLTEVQVLDIGELRSQEDASGAVSGVVPVTFRLSGTDALQLTFAEEFSGKLRLALVSSEGGDDPGSPAFCSGDEFAAFTEFLSDQAGDEEADERRGGLG